MLQYLIHLPVASIIFVITLAMSFYGFSHPEFLYRYMLHPYGLNRDKKKAYLLVSSGFIHRDWMHLLFNMITFYYFAFGLERLLVSQSGSLGHLYFALIYLGSLILSSLPTVKQQKDNPGYYSLGASGAICAVLFSYILFDPKMMLGLFMIIPIPAYLFAFLFLFYCIWAAKNSRDGINHDAHFFGALSGLILTIIFYPWVIQHCISQFF